MKGIVTAPDEKSRSVIAKHIMNENQTRKKQRHPILCFFTILAAASLGWMKSAVGNVTFDEIAFHLSMPMEGTDLSMFVSYFKYALLPSLALEAVILLLISRHAGAKSKVQKKREGRLTTFAGAVKKHSGKILACLLCVELLLICHQLSLGSYIANRLHASTWIEENYVSPETSMLHWPQKKRNLIYIYLESMEASFMSEEDGGAYDVNYIPELTDLARQNVSFSDRETGLGGAQSLTGTTWTMGAMFAQTSGLPLKIVGDVNGMSQYGSFFPGATTLGDLLREEGYSNILMIGSDATFGGRRTYFQQHGDYEICDYSWAAENGKIPEDYWQFWGFEDAKLIEMAKEKLLEVSAEDEPFNLTMLTVDTHFPDGYRCELCQYQWGQLYKDALSCSSRQIAQFIEWIKQQDFYPDTTIVISGDHLSMSALIANEIPDSERRVYNCIINSAAVPAQTQNRVFTTIDMFPTTLAALGVRIDGERLGLGTNLFSETPTLAEEIGFDRMNQEVSCYSRFFSKLARK